MPEYFFRPISVDANWTIIFDEPPTDLQQHESETTMPNPRYVECIDCETEIDREYYEYYTAEDGYRCHRCHHYRPQPGTVHSYGYKPRHYKSKGNYPTEVLMGVELEVSGCDDDIANRVAEVDGDESTLYCKEDGSIEGAEIVSHPFTLNWVKSWGQYETLLQTLREDGCGIDKDSCACSSRHCRHEYGLHVHVSRNAFKQLRKRRVAPEAPAENETYEQRLGRELRAVVRAQREQQAINHQMTWLMFLERNADKLNGDDKLARRDSTRWGAFKESTLAELRQKGEPCQFFGEERYMAINCQNSATYELRFFKSTLDIEEFYAALEFADASVEYTRQIHSDDVLRGRALQWSNFVGWINERKAEDTHTGVVDMKYPNLISQINTLGL